MKFVIVCSSRVGSTMLNGAFNNDPKISGYDEVFTPKSVKPHMLKNPDPFIQYMRNHRWVHSLWFWYYTIYKPSEERIFDNTHLMTKQVISDWLDWLYSCDKNVVFKLLWDHINRLPVIVELIKEKGVKVIYLSRDPKERVESMKFKFGYKEAHEEMLIQQTLKQKNDILRWFPDHLKITYEELTGNKQVDIFPENVTRKIFNFLELPYRELRAVSKKVR